MTREEIEKLASDYLNDKESTMDMERLFEFAIQMTEPCEDCVSREEAADEFASWFGYNYQNQFFYKRIKSMPSVQPEQKTGKWITKNSKEQGYDIAGIKTWYIQIMCDKCGFIKTAIEGHTGQYKFCPNCGAKMEVSE